VERRKCKDRADNLDIVDVRPRLVSPAMGLRTRCSANAIRSLRLSELCGLARYSSSCRCWAGGYRRRRGREREMGKGSWGENTNVYISYYAMQSLLNSVS